MDYHGFGPHYLKLPFSRWQQNRMGCLVILVHTIIFAITNRIQTAVTNYNILIQ